MIKKYIPLVCFLVASCSPKDTSLQSFLMDGGKPDHRFTYYELGDEVSSTPVKSRLIDLGDSGRCFQYCVTDSGQVMCGELRFDGDTGHKVMTETVLIKESGRIIRDFHHWRYAERKVFQLPQGPVMVFKYDSNDGTFGCNSLYWTEEYGLVYWSNFILTVSRKTEKMGDDEENKTTELLISMLRQDQDFLRRCHFVHQSRGAPFQN